MSTIRARIPPKREAGILFLACIFPIHFRAYVVYFFAVPAYLMRMQLWDLVGILSYVLVVALFESLTIWGALLFVNFTLPSRYFRKNFLAQGIVLLLMTFLWILPLHFQNQILELLKWNLNLYQLLVGAWVLSFIIGVLGFSWLIHNRKRAETALIALSEILSPLSFFYLFIDLLSIAILIIRNI